MIRKALTVVLGIVFLACIGTVLLYLKDSRDRRALLATGSQVALTRSGAVEYRMIGDTGSVVALLHGTPGGHDTEWSLPGYRVLVMSRPGYLRTPLSTGVTPTEQAVALAALLDVLGVERVAVIGLSAGGPAAIHFAARFPARTTALIALEAASEPRVIDDNIPLVLRSDFVGWASFAAAENLLSTERLLATVVPDKGNRDRILRDPAKVALAKRMLWQWWPGASGRAAGIRNDLLQLRMLDLPYSQINVPTLIIHGDKDSTVPLATSTRLAERIAGSRLQIIPDADHFMIVSHSEIIKELIDDFLGSLERKEQAN